jgi:hypothetical protein
MPIIPPNKLGLFQSQLGCLTLGTLLVVVQPAHALAGPGTEPPRAAVFSDSLPGLDQALAREISGQVQAAGYTAEFIGATVLTNQTALTAKRYDLLVLPGARALPMVAAPVIQSYLQEGGDLLALGLPAWQSPLFQVKGQWMSRQSYEEAVAAQRAQHMIEDFDHADLKRWTRSTAGPEAQAEYELADADHGKALQVKVGRLFGWDTFLSPPFERPFPTNRTLTCFRAKGGPLTRQLSLEWREDDNSRWIATVDLTTEWKDYALLPERFKPWPVPNPGEKRGHFEPARAVSCAVGLAWSHTALEGEKHEYWFDNLGSATNPFGDETAPEGPPVPVLESISPSYQCFPITTPVVVRPDHQKVPWEGWEKMRENGGGREALTYVGLNPRARGVGFEQGRPYRWEPLLGAYDAANRDYRGALGALVVNLEAPYRGSVWAVFTPAEASFYRQAVVTNCLRQTLSRMKRGVFLSEGGSEFFTVFAGQQFKVGAGVVNFGREAVSNLHVSVMFLNTKGVARRTALDSEVPLAPGEAKIVGQDGLSRQAGEANVSASLTLGGAVVDGLRHELGVWEPKAKPQYIEARDGGFWWRGKPWKAHGVNYMPSSGVGLANGHYFEHWVGRGAYDPEVIERDLRRVKAMNLNAVSVFIHHESLGAQHLLDLLRRCEALGLHVNQSLRPGTPMDFQWREMKELIEHYKLAQNDAVYAYDLAWEPSHGSYAEQDQAYAGLWNQWVAKRYGSVPGAEKVWGVPAPRKETNSPSICVPPMTQLRGNW